MRMTFFVFVSIRQQFRVIFNDPCYPLINDARICVHNLFLQFLRLSLLIRSSLLSRAGERLVVPHGHLVYGLTRVAFDSRNLVDGQDREIHLQTSGWTAKSTVSQSQALPALTALSTSLVSHSVFFIG
jgi:hypothetical protein